MHYQNKKEIQINLNKEDMMMEPSRSVKKIKARKEYDKAIFEFIMTFMTALTFFKKMQRKC